MVRGGESDRSTFADLLEAALSLCLASCESGRRNFACTVRSLQSLTKSCQSIENKNNVEIKSHLGLGRLFKPRRGVRNGRALVHSRFVFQPSRAVYAIPRGVSNLINNVNFVEMFANVVPRGRANGLVCDLSVVLHT